MPFENRLLFEILVSLLQHSLTSMKKYLNMIEMKLRNRLIKSNLAVSHEIFGE